MTTTIKQFFGSAALAIALPILAWGQDCNEVLRRGIFNTTTITSDATLKKTFDEWLYDMDFQTHDEAIRMGLSVGMVVYGVPLQVGGTFSKEQKDQWRHNHAEAHNSTMSAAEKYSVLTKTVSKDVMNSWSHCIDVTKSTEVFGCWLQDNGNDSAVLTMTFNPLQDDNGPPPKVSGSEVDGGTRLDGKSLAFDLGTIIKKGSAANQVAFRRIHGKPLIVIVHTSRGDRSAILRAVVDKPVIRTFTVSPDEILRGYFVSLKWEVSNADHVMINNGLGEVQLTGESSQKPAAGRTTYTLTASNEGGEASKEGSVEVKIPKITELNVKFHTTDDDKDDDTGLSVVVTNGERQLASWSQSGKEKFDNNSDHTKRLNLNGDVSIDDIPVGAKMTVKIAPVGHDTWRFHMVLSGSRQAGGPVEYDLGDHVLDQDHRELTVNLQ
jgi:hypothetical protein